MRRALVVYFSRTGYTRKIAEEIAARSDADIEPVEDVRSRSGVFGYLRSAREAYKKRAAEIKPAAKHPSDYDVVILGTPVWAGHLSSPMRAYLAEHKDELKRVGVFCTQGGSGAEKVFADMAEVCGRAPAASLAVNDREIKQGVYGEKLDRFLGVLAPPKAA